MLAGYSWNKVRCPQCNKLNEIPIQENNITQWERLLEGQLIKVTCENCKKIIYCQRESEFVSCSQCNTILNIVKGNTPFRPKVTKYDNCKSMVVPKEVEKAMFGNTSGINKNSYTFGGYRGGTGGYSGFSNSLYSSNNDKQGGMKKKGNVYGDLLQTVSNNENMLKQTYMKK